MAEEVKSELKSQTSFRRFNVGDTTIFDDICKLQELIQMEAELKQTFFSRFEEMIQSTLNGQIKNYAER